MNNTTKKWLQWVKDPLTILGIILVGAILAGAVILFQQKGPASAQFGIGIEIEDPKFGAEPDPDPEVEDAPATVHGRIYFDNVPYGIYSVSGDTPDEPINGVEVQLLDAGSNVLVTDTTENGGTFEFTTATLSEATVFQIDILTELEDSGYYKSAGPDVPMQIILNPGQDLNSESLVYFGYTLVPPGFFQTRRGDVHSNGLDENGLFDPDSYGIANHYPGLNCIQSIDTDGDGNPDMINIDSADEACSAEFLVTTQNNIFNFFTRSETERVGEDWLWGDDIRAGNPFEDSYYDLGTPFVDMSLALGAPTKSDIDNIKKSVAENCLINVDSLGEINFNDTPYADCDFIYRNGDLELTGTPTKITGRGTLIVSENLTVGGNIEYDRQNYFTIESMDSFGLIIEGNLIIKPNVDRIVGAFFVGSEIFTNNNAE
ncbi:hypothetical protein ACFL1U_00645 [Patescibacteria group bacterium]